MSWIAVGIAGATIATGLSAAEDAEDAQHAAMQNQQAANAIQQQMADMAQEEWDLYKKHAVPLLKGLSSQLNVQDRSAEEMELAAGDVKAAYGAQRQALARRIGLDTDMSSDRAAALLRPSYLDEAGAVSRAITEARKREKQRVEDTSWGRRLQAIQAYQRLPQDASATMQGSGAIATRNAAINADMARGYSEDASRAGYGAAFLGLNAKRWMERSPASPLGGGGMDPYAGVDYGASYENMESGDYARSLGDFNFRDGGVIRKKGAPRRLGNYNDGGPIRGPGSGTSDSINALAEEGSYVLSADTVRAVGEAKIQKMMEQAGVRPGYGGDDRGGVPVRLSNGEYQVPASVVRFHGEEFFNKLQQKYHRPVDGEPGMANGGAIRRKALPSIVENAIYRSMPGRALSRRRG